MMSYLKLVNRILHQHEDRTTLDLILCFLIHFYGIFGVACFIRGGVQQDGFFNKVESLSPSFTTLQIFISYCIYLKQRKKYFQLIRDLEAYLEANRSNRRTAKIIKVNQEVAERLLLRFTLFVSMNIVLYVLQPLIVRLHQAVAGHDASWAYTFDDSFRPPWDTSGKAGSMLAYLSRVIFFNLVLAISIINTAIPMYFFMMIVAFLKITREKFKDIGEAQGEEAYALLCLAIQSHIEALSLLKKVKRLGSMQYFVMIYSAALGLSFWLFPLAKDFTIENAVVCIPLGLSSTFYIMTICNIGQKVIDEIDKLVFEIYDVAWFAQPPACRRALVFCLMRAQRTEGMRAWKFCELSHKTFKDVMTTAYSYMTFLQSVNE